ncbi:peptidoglycan editing factor PgeF [Jannaschia sp. Os4]|uniref:peptidoglycan editing factor PgeF n=1 Tax=Jannaschia sp. Os4 TaxID=2807617 RepID=UPI00193A71E4|nr:peptidoglycan editing factor PgeF [Jannaschia sp. Os4]MBM2574841.1 peptidoglycan editing factor PgeF [Jannaschia sp. Os4]
MTDVPLDIIRSDLLSAPHGFFGRRGGASSGIFAGLNCGLGSSDQRDAVAANRARVAAAMGVGADDLRGVHQVHSRDVVVVEGPLPEPRPQADAMVTRTPGEVLTVLTADCQPVLFEDAGSGVVGAAHAGWRGTQRGVLAATVDAMEALGAARARIRAAIGPSIGPDAYEVGPDLRDAVLDADPEADRFFRPGAGDRFQFDLPGYGVAHLRGLGLEAAWTGHCTYAAPDRFFSYRRTTHAGEADYGRHIAAIRCPG